MSADHLLHREQWVPRPIEEVFAFFSDARNLEEITPPFLRFQMLSACPNHIAPGTKLDYKLRVHGLPVRWTTEIVVWDPPRRFEDVQLSGPYRRWHHTHLFEPIDGGTRMTDEVLYSLPFGILGRALQVLIVRRDVERIFNYRYYRIHERFGGPPQGQP
jgi:ligand-binding SRPBCC domain-containing protein